MRIKIYYRPHVYTAAAHLRAQLNLLGYNAMLIDSINSTDACLHIIYCAFCTEQLPLNYIVYQTEVPGSHWFNRRYMQTLAGAVAIWDYSISNTAAYKHLDKPTSIVSPGITPLATAEPCKRNIDVLFYGTINARRKKLLSRLQANITVAENKYGEEMYALLRRSKVVLNLHHYTDAALEVFRITEALTYGCTVVGEPGIVADENLRYRNHIYFGSSITELNLCIRKALLKKPEADIMELDNLKEIKAALQNSAISAHL